MVENRRHFIDQLKCINLSKTDYHYSGPYINWYPYIQTGKTLSSHSVSYNTKWVYNQKFFQICWWNFNENFGERNILKWFSQFIKFGLKKKKSFFAFNSKFYIQVDGVAILVQYCLTFSLHIMKKTGWINHLYNLNQVFIEDSW